MNAEEILLRQVNQWCKEIANLQDMVDFATGKSNAANTGQVMSAEDFNIELVANRRNIEGGYPGLSQVDMIKQRDTARDAITRAQAIDETIDKIIALKVWSFNAASDGNRIYIAEDAILDLKTTGEPK